MTRIIPRELIKHLEWSPGQEPPQPTPVTPPSTATPVQQHNCSIESLVSQGNAFYDDDLPTAFRKAQEYATVDGVVASMPYHLAGKATADKRSYLWKNWFTVVTEENMGVDKKGTFVAQGQPVLVTLHGGGILTPERIQQAYDEGLTDQNAARFTEPELDDLLDGRLPDGGSIELYSVDDVKNGRISNPFGRYGVVMDLEIAKATTSGYQPKGEFMENPLVIARAGTLEHLENYFEKAKSSEDKVGSWHPFNNIDSSTAQGRLLFLDYSYSGLSGNDLLYYDGRFVGVAPEAPSRTKK